mmetsp:Transcript_34703/g.73929  ORF Transcript_34703/g.73929 Transcript_34703/m.73929 type:complete len:82 (-) Transcript_34703:136-381(-)
MAPPRLLSATDVMPWHWQHCVTHHMLRMRVKLSVSMANMGDDKSTSNGGGGGGGLVTDASGRLAGIVVSSSRVERSRVDVI